MSLVCISYKNVCQKLLITLTLVELTKGANILNFFSSDFNLQNPKEKIELKLSDSLKKKRHFQSSSNFVL